MTFPPPAAAPAAIPGLPDVFRFEDCCAVYVLRRGERGLLVDLGSGAVLDHLEGLGIRQVQGVYFTHAHRDQCQGADRALAAGIPLHFPKEARGFVDPAQRRDLRGPTPLLRSYPGRFEPPRPFPHAEGVHYDLAGGQRVQFGVLELEAQAAPGHIDHQLAFLLDHGERRACFCGDALHSRGKLHEAYHWETDHYTGAGLRLGRETLRVLRQHRPDLLLPSHGPVTDGECWDVLRETEAAMERLAEIKDTIVPRRPAVRRLVPPHHGKLQQVSGHLYIWNNSYFLVSEAGPVLMVDCAGPLPEPFREQYAAMLGDRPIAAVLVTHIHCDHVEGIEYLRREGWRGEVWAHAALAPCLEEPFRFRRPWLSGWPARVDRRLEEGQPFRFHEHELTPWFVPGQTDLHACYTLTVDGRRAVLSGDNFYPAQQWGGTGGLCGLNGGHPELWRRSIDLYLRLEPEWVLASHIHPFEFRRDDFLAMRAWCGDAAAAMRAIAPDGRLERHHVPHTFNLEPYALETRPGETARVIGSFHNPGDQPVEMAARLVLPAGWSASPPLWSGRVAPGETARPAWEVRAGTESGTHLLTAEIVVDGVYLGEKAECYARSREVGGGEPDAV